MTTPNELKLRIVLVKPTAGVDFGLQKGRGSTYEVVNKQRSLGQNLRFDLTVGVKAGRDSTPDFAGPLVQGARGDRFLYIDIGTYAGLENTEWSRRLKIPLSVVSWNMIKSQKRLIATIPGTGKDGGPSCAYEWRKRLGPSWQWELEK